MRLGLSVKPTSKMYTAEGMPSKFLREIGIVAHQARQRGLVDKVHIMTEQHLHPVELHNARLLHGARRPDHDADLRAAEVVRAMKEPVSLADLRKQAGGDVEGFRALLRLMRSFHLKQVRQEKITSQTVVCKVKNPKV